MTDELGLCPGCFQESRTDGACRRCGYQHDSGAFPSALQPGTVLTKYTLGRVLGKPGGFGITYLAYDGVLQRRVAIKELMPRELVARRPDGASVHVHTRDDGETFKYTLASFLKEARLLAQLTHSNVVRVLDYFEANGTAYFAMEYYEGRTLAAYTMRAGGRLSGAEAVTLMLPLLDALDHIHSLPEPILHRDIKPANIYLTGRQTPILLDFGAARVAMGQQSRSLSAILTPGFAPYEQYSTRGKQGPWSDVYGCAATLYHLVTGVVPREASDRLEDPRLESPRSLNPDLTPQLSEAILNGLGFRPEDRPQSARLFAHLISGRQAPTLQVTRAAASAPGYALAGASAPADLPRTIVESSRSTALPVTEIAPETGGAVPQPPVGGVQPPPLPGSHTRRAPRRMPLVAGTVAAILVGAVAWQVARPDPAKPGPSPAGKTDSSTGSRTQEQVRNEPTRPSNPPVVTPPPSPKKVVPAPPKETAAGQPPREPASPPAQEPPPPAPAPAPANGVLVTIRGDDADGVQRAEGAILRSLVGRNGLEALDSTSLSMMRGDSRATQAAEAGSFAELATLGRQHGVELMVVGELRSRAAPSLNRFFTGTAELSVKMYRVSTSRLVETQTFIVGQGGGQPVLAVSEGEARSRAAAQAADLAAAGVGSWLGRAF
jgi:hypothetical protein